MRAAEIFQTTLLERQLDVVDALRPYKDDPSIFISFTNFPKVGINPRSVYDTPIGIYAYPLDEIWEHLEHNSIPFAGDRDYVQVLKVSGNVPDLSSIDSPEYQRVREVIAKKIGEDLCKRSEREALYKSPGGFLWNLTRMAALRLADIRDQKAPAIWNALFRSLGYDGFIDRDGKGIIHPNEPIQAVFFHKGAVKHIEMVRNVRKSVPDVEDIKRRKEVKRAQANAIKADYKAIQYIENPTQGIQIFAVEQNYRAIQYIKNPSQAVQLAAVKHWGAAIQYIDKPSKDVQVIAVKQNGNYIKYIKNPSEAIQMLAVQRDPIAIGLIENPTEAVQMAAIQQDPGVFRFIKKPSPAVAAAVTG